MSGRLLVAILVGCFVFLPAAFGEDWSLPGNQQPLSLLHENIRPQSAAVIPLGMLELGGSLIWSTTATNRNEAFRFDAESRIAEFEFGFGLLQDFSASVRVPMIWRGAGILDGPVEAWDRFLGVSHAVQRESENNEYEISGINQDGGSFELDRTGTALGNIALEGRYRLLAEEHNLPEISWNAVLSLPTARNQFGHDGVDISTGPLIEKSFGALRLNSGVGVTFLSDRTTDNILFESFSVQGFGYATYGILDSLSFIAGVVATTDTVTGVKRFQSEGFYLDCGMFLPLDTAGRLLFNVRENPMHAYSTTDVTLSFQGRWRTGI